jgi:AraC-like DNA-binding protein
MSELCDLIERHCPGEMTATSIPRLTLTKTERAAAPTPAICHPLLGIVGSGRKRAWVGNEAIEYHADTYLINTQNLPVMTEVISGPFMGVTLELDRQVIASVLTDMVPLDFQPPPCRSLSISLKNDGLQEPVLRLLRLLDRPKHIDALAPTIEKEIIYWLLHGVHGELIRQMATSSSKLSRLGSAIDHIRQNFAERLSIGELARLSGMSESTFHRQFQLLTNLSPIQFQKRIRLFHARRRLITEDSDAASIAFAVGYESPSQFSREYRRLFGEPPGKDRIRISQGNA